MEGDCLAGGAAVTHPQNVQASVRRLISLRLAKPRGPFRSPLG